MPDTVSVDIEADLVISSVVDGTETVIATVSAEGKQVDVLLAGRIPGRMDRRALLTWLRPLAAEAAALGLVLRLRSPAGTLASIGAVRTSSLQQSITGWPFIRLGSVRALASVSARRGSPRLVMPPSTPLPLAPTVQRNRRDRASTTHYLAGSGRPRVIFVLGSSDWDGTPPREYLLLPGTTRIGSAPDADLRLEGADGSNIEIRHTEDDEYVLVDQTSAEGLPLLDRESQASRERVLRTGARIDVGEWRLAFFREEFADHGRPYGGRAGGELSVQRGQKPRDRPTHRAAEGE